MGYWIETDKYKKNIEFLEKRRNKRTFWLFNPFCYEENIKTTTYRGIFRANGYKFTVNFDASSNGKVTAEIISINRYLTVIDFPEDAKLPMIWGNAKDVYKGMKKSVKRISEQLPPI